MNFLRKILAYLASLFGAKNTDSKDDKAENTSVTAEHTPVEQAVKHESDGLIALHPYLVKNLKLDHQQLLSVYTTMLEDAKEGRFEEVVKKLVKFKVEFGAHLTTENTKFYGYLQQQLKQSSQEFKNMRKFRREMLNIERAVNKFLDYWIDGGVDKTNVEEFLKQGGDIAGALVKRIESEEEELYPIYEGHITQKQTA